jgi:hypothetical protein
MCVARDQMRPDLLNFLRHYSSCVRPVTQIRGGEGGEGVGSMAVVETETKVVAEPQEHAGSGV